MMSEISRENWLFDPQVLKLVRECRRLVHSEFGVKLHLTETGLAENLADFSSQSQSERLPQTWSAIMDKVPDLVTSSHEPSTSPKRMYRGQAVVTETPPAPAPGSDSEISELGRTKVIYRGREVT